MSAATARRKNEHGQARRSANTLNVVVRLASITDAMHALLVKRADELVSCVGGSPDEAELTSLVEVIEAYEAQRWPEGKIQSGKG
jgi:hypothetical protein